MNNSIHKSLPLIAVLLVAVFMRLPFLSSSFWLDEAAQAIESSRPLWQQHRIAWDFQPPLLHYVTHFMLYVSNTEWWLRLTSVAAGLGSIVFLYTLLRKKVSTPIAILSSGLVAIAPFHIFYSQELRPYALAGFFAVASWYFLIQAIQKSQSKTWVLFTIMSILGMYSMYLYPFVLLSQVLFILIEHKKMIRSMGNALLVVLLCFLPWIPFFIEQLQVGMSWTELLPGWSAAVATPQLKAIPLVFIKFITGQVEFSKQTWERILLIPAGILFLLGAWRAWQEKKVRFLLYWFVIPLLTVWIVSFVVPVIQPKRLLLILPAFFSLISYGGYSLFQKNTAIGSLFVGSVIGSLLLFFVQYVTNPLYQRENWKQLIDQVQSDCGRAECVAVFAFDSPYAPWQWYAPKELRVAHLSTLKVINEEQTQSEILPDIQNATKLYLFDYLREISDSSHTMERVLFASDFREVYSIDGKMIGFVRVWTQKLQ